MRPFDIETQAQWQKASTVLLPKGENREAVLDFLATNNMTMPAFRGNERCLHPRCSR